MRSRTIVIAGVIALAVVGVSLFLTLSNSSSTAVGGTATTSPSTAPTLHIVFIPKNTGNSYFDPMLAGMRLASQDTGAEVTTVAPATADPTSQIPIIKDQIQRGVNVIAICPNSTDTLVPVLQEAMSKGITVITVDSDLTGNEKARTASVLTVDPKAVGESQIELMGQLIDYKGKFAILSATTEAPNQNSWIKVMKETLASNPKYKDMQLVETVYGNDDPQKSLTEAEALLNKHPDLKGILSPTTVGITAAAQCVQSAGKADKVKVTGLGTPNEMRRFIKDGTVEVFALWSPFEEGYLTGQLAHQIVAKAVTPTPGATFYGGTVGERQFGPNNVVITGIVMTFTKHNIDQFNF